MNKIQSSKKIFSYSWRGMIAAQVQGMNGHSNAPCEGGTTAQGMVIVVELGLLFRRWRGGVPLLKELNKYIDNN